MAVPFGKYQLIKKLATGGMGEVFLARSGGAKGFEKLLVIKRVLPHLAENEEFLELFLDEARIAARLNHPNVAQIFELGEVEGAWYLAMEYVAGRDLRRLFQKARSTKKPMPVGAACRVAADCAAALDYAHKAKDSQGRPLGIVHRDVSPHNILVGFDGGVKLIDFGVAKAADRLQRTDTGMLRGKYPYMSPEQAAGEAVGPASDLFSLGVVFWELLTGRRLFKGDSDPVTLRLVSECRVQKPSSVNPAVPKDLDPVVMRALEKEPARRYADGGAFRLALEDFVVAGRVAASAAHLEAFVRELFLGESETVSGKSDPDRTRSSRSVARSKAGGRPEASAPPQPDEPVPTIAVHEQRLRSTLPPQASRFIGRHSELEKLDRLFARGERLVTLLGPGGTGKTRLAVEFARGWLERAVGSAWFFDLTESRDQDGICAAVGRALDVPLTASDAVAQLASALASRGEALFILDNFEQVAPMAQETVGPWLACAPQGRFLATSREPLRLEGECCFEMEPLGLPDGDRPESSDAVQLFLERARAARPNYRFSEAETRAVAEVVRQLDGLPLAIELAAARISVLSPAQLAERLPRRFQLLASTAGIAGASARQATLKGAIDWSWNLLLPHEQSALAQLSVFRGGFTIEAAEAVLDLSRWPEAPWALDVVQTLREKSLVRSYEPPGRPGEIRFGLYQSIREYALEKLSSMAEGAQAKSRHAAHYLGLGAQLAEEAEGPGLVDALDRLANERENLSAVFHRAIERAPFAGAEALRAVLALDPLLQVRGPFAPHLAMLDSALEQAVTSEVDPELRCKGLTARGLARQARGRLKESVADFELALRHARERQDRRMEGRLENFIAAALRQQGRLEEARRRYERALSILREVGDRRFEGIALSNLGGISLEAGEGQKAQARFRRALTLFQEVGDRRYAGHALALEGAALAMEGRLEEAQLALEQAEGMLGPLGDKPFLTVLSLCRGHLELSRAGAEKGRGGLKESRSLVRAAQERASAAEAAEEGGPSLAASSEHVRAAVRCLRAALGRAGGGEKS